MLVSTDFLVQHKVYLAGSGSYLFDLEPWFQIVLSQ